MAEPEEATVDEEALAIVRCASAIQKLPVGISRARVLKYLGERFGTWDTFLCDLAQKFTETDKLLAKAEAALLDAAKVE
jgi:hypothetical protein